MTKISFNSLQYLSDKANLEFAECFKLAFSTQVTEQEPHCQVGISFLMLLSSLE